MSSAAPSFLFLERIFLLISTLQVIEAKTAASLRHSGGHNREHSMDRTDEKVIVQNVISGEPGRIANMAGWYRAIFRVARSVWRMSRGKSDMRYRSHIGITCKTGQQVCGMYTHRRPPPALIHLHLFSLLVIANSSPTVYTH